jgi:hypothetical protein
MNCSCCGHKLDIATLKCSKCRAEGRWDYEPEHNPPWDVRRMCEHAGKVCPEHGAWLDGLLAKAAAVKGKTLPEYRSWLDELHERACQSWLEAFGGFVLHFADGRPE